MVYHINGAHLPCNLDEYGRFVGDWNSTALEQTKGVFRFLARYLEDMKTIGLYDKTNIIITADHGRFDEGPACPILFVKPAHAAGEMAVSRAMTGAADMHATIAALCGVDHVPGRAVTEIGEDEERERRFLYYPTTRENGGTLPPLTEYRVLRGPVFEETGVTYPGGTLEADGGT